MAAPSWENLAGTLATEIAKKSAPKVIDAVAKNAPGAAKAAADVANVVGAGKGDMWSKAMGLAQNYMSTVGEPARQGVLNFLTTTAQEAGGFPRPATKDTSVRFRTDRSVGPIYEKGTGYDQRWTKTPDDYRPDWVTEDSPIDKAIGAVYENPERVANIAGTATAAGSAVLGGTALNWWAQGDKPRSDYAYNVNPARGSYNSSVESAEASAFYKHQLEEQKFAHKMELMNAREQSRTPGVQNTSMGSYGGGPMDNSAIIGLLQNQFGNTRTYF